MNRRAAPKVNSPAAHSAEGNPVSRKLMFVVNVDWFFLSHRLPIALEAMRQGYQVHIATGLTDRLAELRRHGLVVHPLALDRRGAGLGNAWRTMVQLWQIFKAVQPDVVHLVTIKPVLLGGLVARLARVPAVVAAVSGLGFVFMARGAKAAVRRSLVGALYRVALGHRKVRVIFQNADDMHRLARVAHLQTAKVAMIRGSGVDLVRYAHVPLPGGVPVVVLAARLLADKGVVEFVQAARLLLQRGCNARFVLVGTVDTANPTSFTDANVSAWVHGGAVEWWGQRADMPQVLAAAQLVVLPSYREGLPKILIEAAACGRAVVTTDVPGCRDAIDPGITGVLVPVRDATALANAMETLINDPLRCQAMGDAGRALAEKAFDVRQVVAAHLQIYQELIGKS
jgi:glycosyltransferase involved in cell wall biosynthesis